ncbi:uncharacterized protein [Periplaneta americana]|uniref:uncharacterized protein isoform X2 n=1 Tax=Periplaneta americana TaxID=6978 RepID=UPI0037E889D1
MTGPLLWMVLLLGIFVYCSENERLFTDNILVVESRRGEKAVLPCRPKYPDTEVKLYKQGVEMPLGRQANSNLIVSYNPSTGFTLENAIIADDGVYMCRGMRRGKNEAVFVMLSITES